MHFLQTMASSTTLSCFCPGFCTIFLLCRLAFLLFLLFLLLYLFLFTASLTHFSSFCLVSFSFFQDCERDSQQSICQRARKRKTGHSRPVCPRNVHTVSRRTTLFQSPALPPKLEKSVRGACRMREHRQQLPLLCPIPEHRGTTLSQSTIPLDMLFAPFLSPSSFYCFPRLSLCFLTCLFFFHVISFLDVPFPERL